jgi:hypothetical protein
MADAWFVFNHELTRAKDSGPAANGRLNSFKRRLGRGGDANNIADVRHFKFAHQLRPD